MTGEKVGLLAIEIASIPDESILPQGNGPASDYVTESRRDWASLLSEVYQIRRPMMPTPGAEDDVALELLWVSQSVDNQAYDARIRLFLVIRAIEADVYRLEVTLSSLRKLVASTLDVRRYEFVDVAPETFSDVCQRIDRSRARAIVKQERVDPVGSPMLAYCYSFDRFPETDQDLSRIVNSLTDHPDCAISLQLVPTRLSAAEAQGVDTLASMLDGLASGGLDQSMGTARFSLAQRPAETYRYYSESRNGALYRFGIVVAGNANAIDTLSARVYGHINGSVVGQQSCARFIELAPGEVDFAKGVHPMPWVLNEAIIDLERIPAAMRPGGEYSTMRRLPYVITPAEAAEFFRLPIGSKRVSAGLNVNSSVKDGKLYSSSVINGGDINVGTVKSSPRGDQIGFFLGDLTKHMLIVGTPGSGKSTFSVGMMDRLWKDHGIPFLVIEPAKNEYRALVESIPELQVFTPGKNFISPFIMNPFVPPDNVTLESYKSTLKTAFAAAVTMTTPLDRIFEETVNNAYSKYRWMDYYTSADSGGTFTIHDFVKVFQETFESIGYVGDASNIGRAGQVRLASLVSLFDNINTIPIGDLLSRPTVIELAAIENSEQKALLIALLLLNILAYVNRNLVGDGKLKNVILLEEAHVLLAADERGSGSGDADPAAIAKGLVKRMLAEIRSYGVGVVIADQSPRKVSPDVVALTNIKLAFRLVEATDKEILANSSNMSPAQIERLARLQPGEAFLFFDKLEEPEEVKTDDYRAQQDISITITDEAIASRSRYWDGKQELLKPYPECRVRDTCGLGCQYRLRAQAAEVAKRLTMGRIGPETEDKQVLRDVYSTIRASTMAELQDGQEMTPALGYCVKVHLLRRVKYYSRIPMSEELIVSTLKRD